MCTYHANATTYYLVVQGKVLAEYSSLTGPPTFTYIYAGNQRIAMRNLSNRLFYYLNDHLGSARVLLDSAGLIYDHYRYRAFGEPGTSVVNTGQPNRYTGKPYDVDGGLNLYYYGARYYDASVLRFTQIDPSRGKYSSWGPYVYTLDNPMRLVDHNGKWPTEIHNDILKEALGDLVSDKELAQIEQGSRDADAFRYQDPDHAYMHAMRKEGQTVEDAKKKMEEFISSETNAFLKGDGNDALRAIGMALHPIMDATSLSHEGFQVSRSMLNVLWLRSHRSKEDAISVERKKLVVAKVRAYYQAAKIEQERREDENRGWNRYDPSHN